MIFQKIKEYFKNEPLEQEPNAKYWVFDGDMWYPYDNLNDAITSAEETIGIILDSLMYDDEWPDYIEDVAVVWSKKDMNDEDDDYAVIAQAVESDREDILDIDDNPTGEYTCNYKICLL